jgi:flagellar hook protein FlgE
MMLTGDRSIGLLLLLALSGCALHLDASLGESDASAPTADADTDEAASPDAAPAPCPDAGPLTEGGSCRDAGAPVTSDASDGGRLEGASEAGDAGPCVVPTTLLSFRGNLDGEAAPPADPWDPQSPYDTSNFSTSIEVYDSLGAAHWISLCFWTSGPGAWSYAALANGAEVMASGDPGQNYEVALGTLDFNTSAALVEVTLTSGGTVSFIGAAPNQELSFDFGSPIATGGSGTDGMTAYATASALVAQSQNGHVCWQDASM